MPAAKKPPGKKGESSFRPILMKRLHLRCGDWSVLELRLNRHLQPFDNERPHRHSHGQLLVYLRGQGEQRIVDKLHPAAPGAVFFIPAGTEHTFVERGQRLAICLVADIGGAGPKRFGTRTGWLPAEELAQVRERLNQLAHEDREGAGRSGALEFGAGGTALLLLESCRLACLAHPASSRQGSAVTRRLLRSIELGELPPPPAELARRVGLQQDYLNRLVRRSTGLTLGQWRAHEMLRTSERELTKGGAIGKTALALGFSDANYFSRWFRKQTGMTPRAWQSRS